MIAPVSRDVCDFGRGFYMGTEKTQPLTLICHGESPKFYEIGGKANTGGGRCSGTSASCAASDVTATATS